MGLSGALLTAVSGLRTTQQAVDVVARNVANVDTPGYTRKSLEQVAIVAGGSSIGVRAGEITRALDELLQVELREERGAQSRLDVIADTLARLDTLFGVPGGAGAIDTLFNDFTAALQDLSDSPESASLRAIAVTQAEALAGGLNDLAAGIQNLRQTAEDGITEAVGSANDTLDRLGDLNSKIAAAHGGSGRSIADLLDQRDLLLGNLATLMDIKVQESDDGRVRVFTGSGNLLVDGARSVRLAFDPSGNIAPTSLYDVDASQSGVGILYLDNGSGQFLDLFRDGGVRSGVIAGYRELRDETLVDAQAQLDELAHGLATALSARDISSSAVTVGAQAGFDIDLAALQPGNAVTLTYTDTPAATAHTVTIVRVDDPSKLPLADSATARPDDTVVGIDFSAGVGAAATALGAALGAAFTVSSPSANTLRILDDGAAATVDIDGLTASVTATAAVDQGLGLALFTDGVGGSAYTGSLDGTAQKLGFAARIAVNPAVKADDTTLVVHSTSPATPLGDQSRPHELVERLTRTTVTFAPAGGIGTASSPIVETIDAYSRRVIAAQTGKAASAETDRSMQAVVTRTLEERVEHESGVDIDEELTYLITLEQAYAANARVIAVVQDLMDALTRI